jgi:hypothetical protein
MGAGNGGSGAAAATAAGGALSCDRATATANSKPASGIKRFTNGLLVIAFVFFM